MSTRRTRQGRTDEPAGLLAAARLFGIGEDPVWWSMPFLRIAGVQVRMHAVFILWAAAELVAWLPRHALGAIHVAAAVGAVVLVTLLRELARAAAARALGASAESIVLWPLGGLVAPVSANGRKSVLAQLGGVAAGMTLAPLLACLVVWSGARPETLVFDPLDPRITAATLSSPAAVAAWWLYYVNLIVLGANLLIPAAPFDIWIVLRDVMSRRSSGVERATRAGLVVCLALFIGAASGGETRLMAVAAVAAIITYIEFRRWEFLQRPLEARAPVASLPESPGSIGTPGLPGRGRPVAQSMDGPTLTGPGLPVPAAKIIPVRRAKPPAPTPPVHVVRHPPTAPAIPLPALTLDGVLDKITRTGMDSLTQAERTLLTLETQRRRAAEGLPPSSGENV